MTSPWAVNPTYEMKIPNPPVPGLPYLFFTPNIPPELATWDPSTTFYFVALWYYNNTDYYWQAVITFFGTRTFAEGTYDTGNGVVLLWRNDAPGFNNVVQFGTSFNAPNVPVLQIVSAQFRAIPTGALTNDDGRFVIQDPYGFDPDRALTVEHAYTRFISPLAGPTTAGAAFVPVNGFTALFDKDYENTNVEVEVDMTAFTNNAGMGMELGVRVNGGATHLLAKRIVSAASHFQVSGRCIIAGLPAAGNNFVEIMWRIYNAVGAVNMNNNNVGTCIVKELGNVPL